MKARSTKKTNKDISSPQAQKIIDGAEYSDLVKETEKSPYPWKEKKFSPEDIRKLTLRLPEEYSLKLDFLVKNTIPKTTKQRFFLEKILPLIDKELEKRNIPL